MGIFPAEKNAAMASDYVIAYLIGGFTPVCILVSDIVPLYIVDYGVRLNSWASIESLAEPLCYVCYAYFLLMNEYFFYLCKTKCNLEAT